MCKLVAAQPPLIALGSLLTYGVLLYLGVFPAFLGVLYANVKKRVMLSNDVRAKLIGSFTDCGGFPQYKRASPVAGQLAGRL